MADPIRTVTTTVTTTETVETLSPASASTATPGSPPPAPPPARHWLVDIGIALLFAIGAGFLLWYGAKAFREDILPNQLPERQIVLFCDDGPGPAVPVPNRASCIREPQARLICGDGREVVIPDPAAAPDPDVVCGSATGWPVPEWGSATNNCDDPCDQDPPDPCEKDPCAPPAEEDCDPCGVPPATPIACNPPDDWEGYEVVEGDDLIGLSEHYGISIEEVVEANCLTDLEVEEGQMLFLPVLPAPIIE